MGVLVQNIGTEVAYVPITNAQTGKTDVATVMPGGKVTLPPFYTADATRTIKVSGGIPVQHPVQGADLTVKLGADLEV